MHILAPMVIIAMIWTGDYYGVETWEFQAGGEKVIHSPFGKDELLAGLFFNNSILQIHLFMKNPYYFNF